MSWQTFWTPQGVFSCPSPRPGAWAPTGLNGPIAVPPARPVEESAAMVELAARIGLQALALNEPLFDALFWEAATGAEPPVPPCAYLSADADWLSARLGDAVRPLLKQLDALSPDTGLLYRLPDGRFVITGTTPAGVLVATRYLASDGFGRGITPGDVIPVPFKMARTCSDDSALASGARGTAPMATAHETSPRSLHNVLTTEGALAVPDGLHPVLDVAITLSPDPAVARAGVELAARLAIAAAEVVFPVTHLGGDPRRSSALSIWIASSESTGSGGAVRLEGDELVIEAPSAGLPALAARIGRDWVEDPASPAMDDWRSRFAAITSTHPDVSLRARLAAALHARVRQGGVASIQLPEPLGRPLAWWRRQVEGDAGGIDWREKPLSPLRTFTWSDPGELAELRRLVLDALHGAGSARQGEGASAGEPADGLILEVFTTVPEASFAAWWQGVQAELRSRGQDGGAVRAIYRNAHKAGLHWALTDVLPALSALPGVRRVRLCARRFDPDIPHLDMAHRFLQELYPFDAIVANALNLSRQDVALELADGDAPMWRVVAEDEAGRMLASWSWDGLWESRVYMPEHPELGSVCVPMCGFRLRQGDRVVREARVASDPLRFWDWFQREVLPATAEWTKDARTVPKFLRMTCDVWMDAKDEPLPVGEEVISALEALHEDIYFYALHWFHAYGKRTGDPAWDAPGAILPFVHRAPGAPPSATVRVYPMTMGEGAWVTRTDGGTELVKPLDATALAGARVVAVASEMSETSAGDTAGERRRMRCTLAGVADPAVAAAVAAWVEAAGLGPADAEAPGPVPEEGAAAQADRTAPADGGWVADREALAHHTVPADGGTPTVLGPEAVDAWVARHRGGFPGAVRAYDRSFQGRPIWVLEAFERCGLVTSPVKHRLYKPTLFINARHHANEVSSTNAVLQLAEALRADPAWLARVNVVMVPLENADGAALHQQMASEHPRWKHHAARYNACGVEFAYDHFRPDAPFGESRVYARVWRRWCPDILVDDHGVPSHEWIQPFSGYGSPPRFPVSYWLPIAKMYTIWYEGVEASPAWRAAYGALREAVTAALASDPAVSAANAAYLETFRRWGHAFEPDRFPVQLTNGSLTYVRHTRPSTRSHLAVERFGEAVTAEIITEVDDETVHGEALALCQHAHHVVHRALLDWLASRPVWVTVVAEAADEGCARVRIVRQRPVEVGTR
ncbi:M14 family metallopeptidase [Alicyclobacillus macrosporangiidus]|uniref:Zinc carboxypeptidase n=1 Tax=Alicyclobacillus macrosporangiidus TaxID=392015 RepID=A0A1I7GGX9_9BACL|nr:M14 family metallopeptidase [Alicyclobacillus macrosporangiidus]SFU47536.1 Zinc carboxypeptidase [Alicyclobacillus macrosporangiidus]